jgi:hypothetical protein
MIEKVICILQLHSIYFQTMLFTNSRNKIFLSILMFSIIVVSCNNKEIKLLKETEKTVTEKLCYLKTADHGRGVLYNFTYNSKNQLTNIDGFPDFDLLVYENDLPVKAINSFDKSYHIEYSYDANKVLSQINFVGVDSRNKPYEYKSKVHSNSKKQIDGIDLSLPVFDQIIVTKLEYDANSNLKKIIIVENGVSKTVLENLSFDNKKSPYLNTPISNVTLYFTIFSAIIGSENITYFSNKNNVTSTKIYTDSGPIIFSYKNEYNDNDYASKVNVTKTVKGKDEIYQEIFTYDCK